MSQDAEVEIFSNTGRTRVTGEYGQVLEDRRQLQKRAEYTMPFSLPSGRAREMFRRKQRSPEDGYIDSQHVR